MKDKTGVILIGKGSSKYKSMGFECIESIDNIKMADYYKQIKYIIHVLAISCLLLNAMPQKKASSDEK